MKSAISTSVSATARSSAITCQTTRNSQEINKMRRHSMLFFSVAFFTISVWTAIQANAQDASMKAAQTHAAAAKALAYEPGEDPTEVYDTLCRPALPVK